MLVQYVGPFRAARVVPENGRPFTVRRDMIVELPHGLAVSLTRSPSWRSVEHTFTDTERQG